MEGGRYDFPISLTAEQTIKNHFRDFFYGSLHIAKMNQEDFALQRRVRFRCHVVAVVDTLDQAYLDQTLQLTPHSIARQLRQLAKDHRTLEGVPNCRPL